VCWTPAVRKSGRLEAADGQSADRSDPLRLPLLFLKAGLAGGRLPAAVLDRQNQRFDRSANMLRLRARVATTHAIPAYGGFQLDENALHQIAEAMGNGTVLMQYNHDLARPSSAVIIATGVEPTEDGHLAAWVEFDVDEDEWELFEQEKRAVGAPGGMSFSTTETFATRGESPYDIEIAADASYFDNDLIVSAAGEALPGELSIELARLYQFSWTPDPKVLIDIAAQIVISMPGDLLSAYLYDFANRFRKKLERQPRQPIFELRVRRTPISRSTKIKLIAADDDKLRQAMREIPEILRAEGQTSYWYGSANRWHQIVSNEEDIDH
jgi:hypothetical protein